MGQVKRFFYYLLINVIVSASTTLLVLYLWDLNHSQAAPAALPASLPAASSPVASLGTGGQPEDTSQAPTPTITQVTPEAILLGNVEEYEVEDGDTLGLIAEKFDVSINDIMRVNQISDPNSLSAGMLLYIPVEPEFVPSATIRPSSTPAPTQSGTPAAVAEARLIINSVISAGDIASEQVFLSRLGSGDLSLAGWRLEDEHGNAFVFPQLDLFQGGAVIVWTKSGTNTAVDLYWGMSSAVWQSGDKITVRDAAGKVHTTYTIP